MSEFGWIEHYLRPLSEGFAGSHKLQDDAASLTVPAGKQLIITKDLVIEGVHFMSGEAPELIARKALRVNLSDLAGKGATPLCYFLGLALPKATDDGWVSAFARGLAIDQQEFSISLAGGDTTATHGPLVISITAIGTAPEGTMLTRAGAKASDLLYATGSFGDSAFGLKCVKGELEPRAFLEERYHLPRPRLAIGAQLVGIATACMDVSDGLVQDAGHLARASGVGLVIQGHHVPVSNAATTYIDHADYMQTVLTGGDDYELLFTIPPALKSKVPLGCTLIGQVVEGEEVRVMDEHGADITPTHGGYRHF